MIVVHKDFTTDVVDGSLDIDDTKAYFKSDIALVRLDNHADISKYTPACLPTDSQSLFGKFAVITG